MSDLASEGQGHEIRRTQWYNTMANIDLYKSNIMVSALALNLSATLTFHIFNFKIYL